VANLIELCPCGSNKTYPNCCGRYVDGNEPAPTAEALMRSRYTAYTLLREEYLRATWHHSTRPDSLELATEPSSKWLGLEVFRHECNHRRRIMPWSNSSRVTK